MDKSQIIDTLQLIIESLEDDSSDELLSTSFEDTPSEEPSGDIDDNMNISDDPDTDLLNQLNDIFTPILIMQSIENDVSDEVQKNLSESNLLTERNIIKFDDSSRMAQLISICALLIQRKKNTSKYQMYKKAMIIVNSTKLDMQKEEINAAKALAQKYLVKISTTNNSSIARSAANNLLPETQH